MAQSFDTSLKYVASNYLKLLNVSVTASSAKRDIEGNPYYPSLLSLSDTFDRYRINNKAFKLAPEKLDQLDPPFIAFISVPNIGKDFVVVKEITNESVTYLYKSKRPLTIAKQEFLSQYQNIIWMAEPDENSGEPGFYEKRIQERKIKYRKNFWIAGVSVTVLIAIVINLMNIAQIVDYLSALLIKFLGIAATILLLIYDLDKTNVFIKNICSAGRQTSCDAVLASKASGLLGISWSEIGFFYFAGTALWLLIPSVPFAEKASWLSVATVFAAPYILFSIYYQWRVVRQWCPLCLAVQAVLLLEVVWTISNFRWPGHSGYSFVDSKFSMSVLSIAFCFLAPIVAWYGTKAVFVKSKDADLYAAAFKRLQYNREIFNSLLLQQQKAPDGWQNLGIDLGNPLAENTIIKICNPYCGPCAVVHPVLEEIVRNNTNVRLKVIFTARNNVSDRAAPVVKHLMAMSASGDPGRTEQALDDWYSLSQKSYDVFANKYTVAGELDQYAHALDVMSKWCEEAEIAYTPTIYINGYRLPENYEIRELVNLF